jgi:hypothetical protein
MFFFADKCLVKLIVSLVQIDAAINPGNRLAYLSLTKLVIVFVVDYLYYTLDYLKSSVGYEGLFIHILFNTFSPFNGLWCGVSFFWVFLFVDWEVLGLSLSN